jgi:hypothetical protein
MLGISLRQAGEIEGYRDPHKTFKRDYNYPVRGSEFGVHQHWGYDLPHDNMGNSSAGCLVGRPMDIANSCPSCSAIPGMRRTRPIVS